MSDQPFDERHDSAPVYPAPCPDPSLIPPPFDPRTDGLPYDSSASRAYFDVEPVPVPWTALSHGLTWTYAPGHTLMDLGRIKRETAQDLETLDLRVILAHLDSAAAVLQAELEDR